MAYITANIEDGVQCMLASVYGDACPLDDRGECLFSVMCTYEHEPKGQHLPLNKQEWREKLAARCVSMSRCKSKSN